MILLDRVLDTTLAIEVDGLVPDRLARMDAAEISRIPVWIGKEQIPLAEVFRVRVEAGHELLIRWSGDLTQVHWIGAGLKAGRIEIDSSAGRHVGSQMEGGEIIVRGSVGDFAGAEMRGGLLRIEGAAGDHLGGCYPGSKWGMNGGEILVAGDAGQGVGQSMRRGLIAIDGDVDRLCGWNLLAGSIVVSGNCGADCGSGMVRGTIVQLGQRQQPLLPTFIRGSVYQAGALALIANRLRAIGFDSFPALGTARFDLFHGDQLRGGRGEVFVAQIV